MTFKSVDLFICDRCGNESEKQRGQQPNDWVSVYTVSPPLKSPMEDSSKTLLCGRCRSGLRSWLTSHAEVAVSA